MKNILSKITGAKMKKLALLKQRVPIKVLLNALKSSPAPKSLEAAINKTGVSIIAEVKRASPSKGLIAACFRPVETALEYEKHGASAVSVLTEETFFLGNLGYLTAIKGRIKLPVLRKDFLVDEYQLYESRAAGADAVLLILACLNKNKLSSFIKTTRQLGMDALVEVHDTEEAKTALSCGARIIGINNRDLRTFKIDLKTTETIMAGVPKNILTVSESGIISPGDIKRLGKLGVRAALIGETFMRSGSPGKTLRRFL